jgi:hypothetical protein
MMAEFWVHLVKGPDNDEMRANCTYVALAGRNSPLHWWIFEGDVDYLETRVEVVDEGVVGALGDLSRDELVALCCETFPLSFSREVIAQ